MTKLAEEAVATQEQRDNQRYVDDADVHARSVITLNSMAAGWAANDFRHYATGADLRGGYRILRSRPVTEDGPQLTVQDPLLSTDCRVCGTAAHSISAAGDGAELSTRAVAPNKRQR